MAGPLLASGGQETEGPKHVVSFVRFVVLSAVLSLSECTIVRDAYQCWRYTPITP